MKPWGIALLFVAACTSDERVNALEKRIDELEKQVSSDRANADRRFERAINDFDDLRRVLPEAQWWWCSTDGSCHRSRETCGVDCKSRRVAYCGGDGFRSCFVDVVMCAQHNHALAARAKPTETTCLGVE